MNISAVNRGFVDRFERTAAYDFFAFYPGYVNHYDYERDLEGHIVDVDTSIALTHTAIRSFVRDLIADPDRYLEMVAAYSDQLPNSKVYDLGTRKVVVRHMRGDWTAASSMKDMGTYLNTAIDLTRNYYMGWVGGYQRNRVYYGDLIVPVARKGVGPVVRNDSILPIHVVKGLMFPNRINATGLLLEDWVEYRVAYTESDWMDTDLRPGLSSGGFLFVRSVVDPDRYRFRWTNEATGEIEYSYFDIIPGQLGARLRDAPFEASEIETGIVQEYRSCEVNYAAANSTNPATTANEY